MCLELIFSLKILFRLGQDYSLATASRLPLVSPSRHAHIPTTSSVLSISVLAERFTSKF